MYKKGTNKMLMKMTPALPKIVAICYKWYADFNVIIAIVTTNDLFATNE